MDHDDVEHPDESGLGLAAVMIARQDRRGRLTVCGYLVDTGCLGIKNALGPKTVTDRRLLTIRSAFFRGYDSEPLPAPLELAQHLVYGAKEYARSIGFEPHPDYRSARTHLGEWTGPSAITFGRNGKPFYFQGPHDNSAALLRTLDRTVGRGKYEYVIVAGGPGW